MKWADLVLRIRGLLFRFRAESDLDEELQFHLEMEAHKHLAAGLDPPEARLQAKIAAEHKLKVEFSEALTKEHEELLKGKGKVVAQKGVRLDIVLHQFLTDAGIPPVCVVKGDVLLCKLEGLPDMSIRIV